MWPRYKTQLPKAHIWSDSVFWVETEPCDVCIKVTFNLLTCPSPTLPSCSSNGYLSYVILLVFVWISYGCRLGFVSFEIFYRRSFQSVANRLPCKSLGVRFNILASLWRKVEAPPRWCDPVNSFKVGFVISTTPTFGQALVTNIFFLIWGILHHCGLERNVSSATSGEALTCLQLHNWAEEWIKCAKMASATPHSSHHFQHRVLVFRDSPIHKVHQEYPPWNPRNLSETGRQNYLLG